MDKKGTRRTDTRKTACGKDQQQDNSLQGKALQRACEDVTPRTLTPYEWEQWYAEHGIPESHRAPPSPSLKPSWLSRLRSLFTG